MAASVPAPAPITSDPEHNSSTSNSTDWPSPWSSYSALTIIILATFINFFDATIFGMLAERIKTTYHLTDEQLGFLGGPANIIFYVFVGIPLARLADIFPRKYVLAGGISIIGALTALGGVAQSFWQFVGTRMFVGAGGSAHGPASYSLLADAFPPHKITRAFSLLQLGFIGGTTLGVYLGGKMIAHVAAWPTAQWHGLTIYNWQWILIAVGLPGILIGCLFFLIKEPHRRRAAPAEKVFTDAPAANHAGRKILTFMGLDAVKAIQANKAVYYPLFFGLGLSAIETFGLQFWRTPFMIRTYGWNEEQIGEVMAPMLLTSSLLGIFFGGIFVEWLAKRYRDANVRAACILFGLVTICSIATPLMPTGESALLLMSLAAMFGIAGAVPQNAAIQRIAPPAMRGQVTAIYLFMFTFFGAMGSLIIGVVTHRVVGDPDKLWQAMVITAAVLLPLATYCMYRGIKPYGQEIKRLDDLEITKN